MTQEAGRRSATAAAATATVAAAAMVAQARELLAVVRA
jgi:hypothetical protein